ncbi:MAG TPA: tetratricopeptide repeat protein, partial [Gemmatimonadales bacterium]|nr:tetratricopeptide repeat protein [Gemmatimonadales bacterium]
LVIGLIRLRRYPEAHEAAERALAIDPRDPALHQNKAMVFLAEGNLPEARAVVTAAQREVEPTALVAWMATYWDLYWVLDDQQQRLLLRLRPGPFGDDRLLWGLALAATHAFRGDTARARAYADSARLAGEAEVREAPEDGQRHVLLGTALAYLGRKAEAVREGERAVTLLPVSRDANLGAYVQHQLVRIYLLDGEPERALDQLEPLLNMPYYLSPGWLKIDPTFDPLRGNPRFQRLIAVR